MKLLLALLIMVSSVVASAQSRIISIDAFDLSYTGGLLIKNDSGKSPSRSETTFRLNLNYAQDLPQYLGLMWKARAYYNRQDVDWGGDSLSSNLGASGGLLYNFQPNNMKESFYVSGLIGVERGSMESQGRNDKAGFNFFTDLEGGKRFDLGEYSVASLAYSPSIAVTLKRYGGGMRDYHRTGNELRINFLKFDIMF